MSVFVSKHHQHYLAIKSRNQEQLDISTLEPDSLIHVGEQATLKVSIPSGEYRHQIHLIATKGSQIEITERESWQGSLQWMIELIEPYAGVTFLTRSAPNEANQTKIHVSHQADYTESRVDSRYCLNKPVSVRQHTILEVPKGLQKCQAQQSAEVLLLGDVSQVNIIPELRVATDTSNANHGVSMHQLRDEELFYLMSRGLSREESTECIVDGFLSVP